MPNGYAFNPYAVPMALAGAGMFFVGTVVSFRRRFDLLGTFYLGVCLSSALWLLGFTGAFLAVEERTAFLWDKYVSLFGVMWIPSFCYLYSLAFVGRLKDCRACAAAALAVSAFFSGMLLFRTPWMLQGMHSYFFGWYSAYGPGMKYFLLAFAVLMSAGNTQLFKLYKSTTSGIRRQQALWPLLGFVIGTVGAYDYLPAYGYETYPFGYIFMFGFVLCFAYGLEAYDVMDVRTAFVQSGAYVAAALILVLPLAVLSRAVRPIVEGFSLFGWTFYVLFMVLGVQVYWKWAEKRVVRFVLGGRQLLKERFIALHKSLRYSAGLKETVEAAGSTLAPGLGLRHMSYWHLQSKGGVARRLAGASPRSGDLVQVPPALLERLSAVEEVQEVRDLPKDPFCSAFIQETEAALILPIRRLEELQGFFILGAKTGHKAFKAYELQLLNDFRERLGEAMASAVMTEQIQKMAAQVLQAEQRSRELDKVKGAFLEAVSHELKTPLFTLKGYAEALVGSQASTGANAGMEAKIAQTIGRAAERVADVVANMVQAATMEQGGSELRLGWFDFSASAERVIAPFRKKLGLVRFAVEAEPGLFMYGDKDKIEDILFRLVSNAAKFSPPEGTVTVWGRREGEGFEFGVSDQGPGLSDQAQKHVFEKFNRPYDGPDSVNLKHPGSGLGLYMSKMLVDIHRGKLEIDSGAKGCRVITRLPQPPVPHDIRALPAAAAA